MATAYTLLRGNICQSGERAPLVLVCAQLSVRIANSARLAASPAVECGTQNRAGTSAVSGGVSIVTTGKLIAAFAGKIVNAQVIESRAAPASLMMTCCEFGGAFASEKCVFTVSLFSLLHTWGISCQTGISSAAGLGMASTERKTSPASLVSPFVSFSSLLYIWLYSERPSILYCGWRSLSIGLSAILAPHVTLVLDERAERVIIISRVSTGLIMSPWFSAQSVQEDTCPESREL